MIGILFKLWWILKTIGMPLLIIGLTTALLYTNNVFYVTTDSNSIIIGITEEYSEESIKQSIQDSKDAVNDPFMKKLEEIFGDDVN